MSNFLVRAARWVRNNEPAVAAGLVASGAAAVVDQVVAGTLRWQDAIPLATTALVRYLVFKPNSVVVARVSPLKRVEEIVPGPGASR